MSSFTDENLQRRLERLARTVRSQSSLDRRVIVQLGDALPDAGQSQPAREVHRKSLVKSGEFTMLQRISVSGICAALVMMFLVWVVTSTHSVSLAQVARNVQEASSFSADTSMEVVLADGSRRVATNGKSYWRAPGDFRHESQPVPPPGVPNVETNPNFGKTIQILSKDKPGVRLDLRRKSYRGIAAKRGVMSPLLMLHRLVDFKDDATRKLGTQNVAGTECEGFEIDLEQIDSNLGGGTLTLWVDRQQQLPVRLRIRMANDAAEMTMENFVWNQELDAALFDTSPPDGFVDKTPPPRSVEEQAEAMVAALELCVELTSEYPQVKMIYGDAMRSQMMKAAGYSVENSQQWLRSKTYQRISQTTLGWALMNEVMATSPDASYHGLQVAPGEANKVLFRWKLDDGRYLQIMGDLSVTYES